MQTIAMENNLSETAFFVRENDQYHIRWFTPAAEVELCGHATLATAHVIFNHLDFSGDVIEFASLSGILKVSRIGSKLTLDFPGDPVQPVEITPQAIGMFSRAYIHSI
ncbi:MAG: PhzF family phenazine biosynthesis protein [Ignavibacteriales bacterium]|nr:PhzF family phenazine biosynthesis protein [Ignavibacteriales bacterium]